MQNEHSELNYICREMSLFDCILDEKICDNFPINNSPNLTAVFLLPDDGEVQF